MVNGSRSCPPKTVNGSTLGSLEQGYGYNCTVLEREKQIVRTVIAVSDYFIMSSESSESEDSAHSSDTDRDEEALASCYDDTKCDPYRSDLVFFFRFSSEFS